MMTIIRPYRPEDKPFLQEICRATAHKGFQKNALTLAAVTILYNDYYTECEPENVIVAADERDRPVGYILCSTDWKKYLDRTKKVYAKRVRAVYPTGTAELFASRLLLRLLPKKYRAHLHIDILDEYQRQGLGTRLIGAMRAHLAEKGVPYLSVLSVSTSSSGFRFYRKYGFRTIRKWVPGQVGLTIETREKTCK